jgi:hypothetical protein
LAPFRDFTREEFFLEQCHVTPENGFDGLSQRSMHGFLEQILLLKLKEHRVEPSIQSLSKGSWIVHGVYEVDEPGHPRHGEEYENHFIAIFNDVVMDSNLKACPPYRLSRRFLTTDGKNYWPKLKSKPSVRFVPDHWTQLLAPSSGEVEVLSDTETDYIELVGDGKKRKSGYKIRYLNRDKKRPRDE